MLFLVFILLVAIVCVAVFLSIMLYNKNKAIGIILKEEVKAHKAESHNLPIVALREALEELDWLVDAILWRKEDLEDLVQIADSALDGIKGAISATKSLIDKLEKAEEEKKEQTPQASDDLSLES